jgi:hypothetical protein
MFVHVSLPPKVSFPNERPQGEMTKSSFSFQSRRSWRRTV